MGLIAGTDGYGEKVSSSVCIRRRDHSFCTLLRLKAYQGDNISCLSASRESLWESGGMALRILNLGCTEGEWSASEGEWSASCRVRRTT